MGGRDIAVLLVCKELPVLRMCFRKNHTRGTVYTSGIRGRKYYNVYIEEAYMNLSPRPNMLFFRPSPMKGESGSPVVCWHGGVIGVVSLMSADGGYACMTDVLINWMDRFPRRNVLPPG